MSELYLMVTISDRNFHRRLLAFYKEYGVTVTMVTLGRGTATSEVLDSFGLEAAEKAIQFAFVTGREWKEIRSGLEKRLKQLFRKAKKQPPDKTLHLLSFFITLVGIVLVLVLALTLLVPELVKSFHSLYLQIESNIPRWTAWE